MMEKIDLDGDGNISLQEFVEMNMKWEREQFLLNTVL